MKGREETDGELAPYENGNETRLYPIRNNNNQASRRKSPAKSKVALSEVPEKSLSMPPISRIIPTHAKTTS